MASGHKRGNLVGQAAADAGNLGELAAGHGGGEIAAELFKGPRRPVIGIAAEGVRASKVPISSSKAATAAASMAALITREPKGAVTLQVWADWGERPPGRSFAIFACLDKTAGFVKSRKNPPLPRR